MLKCSNSLFGGYPKVHKLSRNLHSTSFVPKWVYPRNGTLDTESLGIWGSKKIRDPTPQNTVLLRSTTYVYPIVSIYDIPRVCPSMITSHSYRLNTHHFSCLALPHWSHDLFPWFGHDFPRWFSSDVTVVSQVSGNVLDGRHVLLHCLRAMES